MQKGDVVMSKELIQAACHPEKSVVVKACAGSGKTWLLVSRMVRLLLAGSEPHEILAITFTRKAAQEMRGRLDEVLLHFAKSDESTLLNELIERGLTQSEAQEAIPVARNLFEKVLSSPRSITIDTFHGWFARLLGSAPIGSGVPQGLKLRDDLQRLQDDCLEDWWTTLPHTDKRHLREAYELLIRELGANHANELLVGRKGFLSAKSEWFRYLDGAKQSKRDVLSAISELSDLIDKESPLKTAWDTNESLQSLENLASLLKSGTATDQKHAQLLNNAIALKAEHSSLDEIAQTMRPAFLTAEFELLKKLSTSVELQKALNKQANGEELIAQFNESRLAWAQIMLGHYQWHADHRAHRIHQAWVLVGTDILRHYQAKKEVLRAQDFSDLESYTAQLMLSTDTAAYLQARLDAKYKHLLIDEFQDTNPIQWQILLSWLNAYEQDESKPSVFLVGDPKQSIYRFRRADVRLFEEAQKYLEKNFDAKVFTHNETRRNSPAVLSAVNQTFSLEELPKGYPFDTQTRNQLVENKFGDGEVYRLPLVSYPEVKRAISRNAVDEPFIDLSSEARHIQSYQEALLVGQLILNIKEEKQVPWDQFLILLRSRTPLASIEKAFRELGIPCDSPRKGGLLKTLEAEDLIALLSVLVMPGDDLSLAQVLKSPIYGLDDSELMSLVIEKRQKNVDCLWHLIQKEDSSHHHVAVQITEWINKAKHLPVHDLLDHIYHSAQIRLRYVESSPKLQREQVLSNLDAFLGLALDLDGGRYPSLTRFIGELKKIKRGAEEESPDEGESLVEDDDQAESTLSSKQVRILTIHAAKGLESRYVFLMNANSSRSNQDHVGVLMNWQPDQPAPSHMSPFFAGKPRDLARQHLREQEDSISQIENWNLLYVALTRAKESVYISGAAAKANQAINESSWYGRLSRAGIPELEMGDSFSKAPNLIQDSKLDDPSFKDFVVSWSGSERSSLFAEDLVFTQDQQMIDLGVAFHLVMEHVMRLSLTHVDQLPSTEALMSWLNLPRYLALDARACAHTTLQSASTHQFFFNSDILQRWSELDIADSDGRLLRIDALVEYPDRLLILDYKLSIPEPDTELFKKYQKQMSVYQSAVRTLRSDKPIKSYLISAQGEVLELIE